MTLDLYWSYRAQRAWSGVRLWRRWRGWGGGHLWFGGSGSVVTS